MREKHGVGQAADMLEGALRHRHMALGAAVIACVIAACAGIYFLGALPFFSLAYDGGRIDGITVQPPPTLDTHEYDVRQLALAHIATSSPYYDAFLERFASTTATTAASSSVSLAKLEWPVADAPYPEYGALLPFHRIVAYYGNFYSKGMGVLGEYPEDQVLTMLEGEVQKWEAADPSTPVIPAIDYIAVAAQAGAGKDGKYRARMPDDQIDHALEMANRVHGIVILDVQVGLSTLQEELPALEKYLAMPNVELAIDPEFSMKDGVPPGDEIGTFNAADINYAAHYLATLVQLHHLPPKVLIVHRFTYAMVTGTNSITPLPEVQIVMDMDGWGSQAKKIGTYNAVINPYPVQFTGIKLFYKNDLKPPSTGLLSTSQVLDLTPAPIFIQYQ
ncbi:MAG TPA: hypothetical protein VFL98_00270 [Candidatus Paceibacterota bacterium]|nr:hypothetical protein [Candidatus Paceibacterota bacterium]